MPSFMQSDNEIYQLLCSEIERQKKGINLIASENYVSNDILMATGSILTNKYAEGYPKARYYSGCDIYDKIESIAIKRAMKVFNAEHVNVQPHSGSNANLGVYFSVMKPGDTLMTMNLDHGGHLTHGSKVNCSGKIYNVISYGVSSKDGFIDYDEAYTIAKKHNPRLIVVGASSYPRKIEFEKFAEIAKINNSFLMADIAHIAGLVAAGLHASPFPYVDFATSTTHKTLRGPRSGIILSKLKYKKKIDKSVFPGLQGGPLMHVIAAKAICFKEAMSEMFYNYQKQVLSNSLVLANSLKKNGFTLLTGGTDTHMLLIDVSKLNMTGDVCQKKLEKINIYVNKNKIPYDKNSALVTSGIRIGTPAITTQGLKEIDMVNISEIITNCLYNRKSSEVLKKEVIQISSNHNKEFLSDYCEMLKIRS